MSFLDDLPPLKWSNPKAQQLKELLASNVNTVEEIRVILSEAGLPLSKYRLGSTPELDWHHILETTHKMGADQLRRLLSEVEKRQGKAVGDRIRELDSDRREIVPAPRTSPEELQDIPPVTDSELERIFGKSALLDVAFLSLGVQRARSVVRIYAVYGEGIANGTGFLIAPDVVLSNHHVLLSEGRPTEAGIWLDYENSVAGTERPHKEIRGIPESITGEQGDDWAILRLEKPAPEGYEPLSLFPKLPAKAGDRCYIVQHPGGGPKQIGLHKNLVRFADDKVVQYFTDTMGGSSGSPVFNNRWEVVALHHRYIQVPLPNKRVEIRNQGIAIARVVAGLKSAGCLPEGQKSGAAS